MDGAEFRDRFVRVLAEADAEQAADAAAVAVAVYAEIGLADRLRSAIDMTVVLQVAGTPVVGTVDEVNAETVTLRGAGNRRWLVRLAAIDEVRGLPSGHRAATGGLGQRLGLSAALRRLAGDGVVVAFAGQRSGGRLRRVGADHIELDTGEGFVVIAFRSIAWVRTD